MTVSWHSTMHRFLCDPGEQEDTDVELSPEGPHHPAPRAAAPHLHLEVSLAICAQPGQSAKVINQLYIPKAPHALQPASDSKAGSQGAGEQVQKKAKLLGATRVPPGPLTP